jgi:hypothetical protein
VSVKLEALGRGRGVADAPFVALALALGCAAQPGVPEPTAQERTAQEPVAVVEEPAVVEEIFWPLVVERHLPDDARRCELTLDYLRTHHPAVAGGSASASCEMEPHLIVLHWTGSTSLDAAWDTFAPAALGDRPELAGAGAVNVAAQFLVDRDGTIVRVLPETRVARHTIGLNHLAVGIENVGGTPDSPLTPAQVEANAALVRSLVAKHPISHLIGHYEYRRMEAHPYFQELDPTYRTIKMDPGPEFIAAVRTAVEDLGLEGPPAD